MKSVAFVVIDDDGRQARKLVGGDVTVRELKESIRWALGYACPAAELTLYLAKYKHNGQWISAEHVKAIRRGEVPVAVRAIVEDASAEMSDPNACVGDCAFGFPDEDDSDDDDNDNDLDEDDDNDEVDDSDDDDSGGGDSDDEEDMHIHVLPESVKRARRLTRYCANSPHWDRDLSLLGVMLHVSRESVAPGWRWLKTSLSSGADKKKE